MNNPFRVLFSRTPVDKNNPTENATPTMGVWAAGPVSNAVAGSIHRKRTQQSVQKHKKIKNTPEAIEEEMDVLSDYLTEFHAQQYTSSGSTEVPLSVATQPVNAEGGSLCARFRVTREDARSIYKYSGIVVPPISRFRFPTLVPPTLQSPIVLYQRAISPDTSAETSFPTLKVPQIDSYQMLMDHDVDFDTLTAPSTATPVDPIPVYSPPLSQLISNKAMEIPLSQARRRDRTKKPDQVLTILRSLQKANMTTLDLLLAIHGQPDSAETENKSQKAELKRFRQGFFLNQGLAKFRQLLTGIFANGRSNAARRPISSLEALLSTERHSCTAGERIPMVV